jgi:GDP-L-fucose synthase
MSVFDDRDQVAYTPGPLDRGATCYVAGHRGLVGSAIWRRLESQGFQRLVGRTSAELDLKDRDAVFGYFAETRPRYVVLAAAKVGGILANSTYPADFISDNLRMQVNVFDAAARYGATKLLFLGSSCICPKLAPQPIREDSAIHLGHAHEPVRSRR